MMSRKQAQELSDDLLWTIRRAERVSAIAYGRHVPGWQDITGSAVLTLSTVIDHLGQATVMRQSTLDVLVASQSEEPVQTEEPAKAPVPRPRRCGYMEVVCELHRIGKPSTSERIGRNLNLTTKQVSNMMDTARKHGLVDVLCEVPDRQRAGHPLNVWRLTTEAKELIAREVGA